MNQTKPLLFLLTLLTAQSDMVAMSWFRSGLHGGWQRLQQARQAAGKFWDDQVATQLRSGALKVGDILTSLKEHSVCIARGSCTLAQRRRIGLTLIALGTAMTMIGVAAKLRSRNKLLDDNLLLAQIRKNDSALSDSILEAVLTSEDAELLRRAAHIIENNQKYAQRSLHLPAIEARIATLETGESIEDFANTFARQASHILTRGVPLPAPIVDGSQAQPPVELGAGPGAPLISELSAKFTLREEAPPQARLPYAAELRQFQLRKVAQKELGFTPDEKALVEAATKEKVEKVKKLLKKGLDNFSLKAIETASGKASKSDNISLRRALVAALSEKRLERNK